MKDGVFEMEVESERLHDIHQDRTEQLSTVKRRVDENDG